MRIFKELDIIENSLIKSLLRGFCLLMKCLDFAKLHMLSVSNAYHDDGQKHKTIYDNSYTNID